MSGVVLTLGAVVLFIVISTVLAGGSLDLGTATGRTGNLQPFSRFTFQGGRGK